MRFKVGEYVRHIPTGDIVKVTSVSPIYDYVEETYPPVDWSKNSIILIDYEKLRIKFKPFTIYTGSDGTYQFVSEERHFRRNLSDKHMALIYLDVRSLDGETYHATYSIAYDSRAGKAGEFNTIEDARDWLELEYAKILANRL
jgi:hypothetical protein